MRLLKTSGKRVQKFHDTPDEFKKQFNRTKYPTKDDGLRLLVPTEANERNNADDDGFYDKPTMVMPSEKF